MNKYDQALRYELFEKEEYALAKDAIKKAEVIFDIGGHVGYFSERCRGLHEEAEIHYFEPVPFLYETAKERLNGDKKLIFNAVGMGAREEEIDFLVNAEKTMQSSRDPSFLNPQGETIRVKMITLEGYLEERQMQKIDVLKMDIEGMEREVLESRKDEVWGKIGAMIVEVHVFGEREAQRFEGVKAKLNQHFSRVEEEVSSYTEKIRLVYCE